MRGKTCRDGCVEVIVVADDTVERKRMCKSPFIDALSQSFKGEGRAILGVVELRWSVSVDGDAEGDVQGCHEVQRCFMTPRGVCATHWIDYDVKFARWLDDPLPASRVHYARLHRTHQCIARELFVWGPLARAVRQGAHTTLHSVGFRLG